MHVFGLWEEAGAPGEIPHGYITQKGRDANLWPSSLAHHAIPVILFNNTYKKNYFLLLFLLMLFIDIKYEHWLSFPKLTASDFYCPDPESTISS